MKLNPFNLTKPNRVKQSENFKNGAFFVSFVLVSAASGNYFLFV